jgi:hypothetical protein
MHYGMSNGIRIENKMVSNLNAALEKLASKG